MRNFGRREKVRTMGIGKKIEVACDARDMKLSELTRKAGLKGGTLYTLKSDDTKDPKFSTIEKVCEVLNMSMDELIQGENGKLKTLEKRVMKLEKTKQEKALNMIEAVIITVERE